MKEMFTAFLSSGLWAVIKAVLLLILALIVAKIAKFLVVKLLTRTKLKSLLARAGEENGGNVAEFTGKLVYLVVFLLFVPGIFESLGMTEVSSPILGLLNTLWGYLPNILAAVVILWAGSFIAKMVREVLLPVFDKLKVNRIQEKAGIQAEDKAKLSHTLAYIVYVLILIPVIIAALEALQIEAVSRPAIDMLGKIFEYIPCIAGALLILVIGCMVAKFAGNIVSSLIASAGLDQKLSSRLEGKGGNFVLSKVVGTVVQVVLVIFFVVESFEVLHLSVLTRAGSAIIGYLPYVLAAALILIACYICDSLAQKALRKSGHSGMALACRVAIYTLGVFMALNELGIASELVNAAFVLIVAAVAVAFAVSFGIGGREFAGRALRKLEAQVEKGKKPDAGKAPEDAEP